MNKIELFLYLLPILLVSLTLHELAHAYVATRLGDETPREEGRLTLNPIAHVDPLGALVFAFTFFLTSVPFGWAKPVHVQPQSFRRPKQAMAVVAAAGPATNFLLALVCVAVIVHAAPTGKADTVVQLSAYLNLVLGIFNLLPVPPLDGSRIAGAFMNDYTYARWSALDQYGILILFGAIVVFRPQFSELIGGALDTSADVMVTLVGG